MKISDEAQLLLDDHLINTQQIGFSPFKAAFEEDIDEWAGKLKLTQEVILLWIDVQRFVCCYTFVKFDDACEFSHRYFI